MSLARSATQLVEALEWTGGVLFRSVHDAFLDEVSAALGSALSVVNAEDNYLCEVTELIERVSPIGLLRFVLAPETTARTTSRILPPDAARFFRESLQAELARDGGAVTTSNVIWSAVGDLWVSRAGSVQHSVPGIRLFPVDLDSPFLRSVHLTGPQTRATLPLATLSHEDRCAVVERLAESEAAVERTDPGVARFLQMFVKVLTLRSSHHTRFECSSLTRFVGRALFYGVGWSEVSREELAESIVHEAIHACLLMAERSGWLGRDGGIFTLSREVISPWTGARIRPSSFIHACFVWYGLVNFWRLAVERGSFEQTSAEGRLWKAAGGFIRRAPSDCLEKSDWELLQNDVKEALWEMRNQVVSSFPA